MPLFSNHTAPNKLVKIKQSKSQNKITVSIESFTQENFFQKGFEYRNLQNFRSIKI